MNNLTRDSITSRIAARMRTARECRGLDQEQVSARMNIDAKRLAEYENGSKSVSVDELERLAQILALPIIYFFEVCPVCGNA